MANLKLSQITPGTFNPATDALVGVRSGTTDLLLSGFGSTTFDQIGSGTNTTAAMVVGAGASLNFASTGTINASALGGSTFAAPGAIGGTTPAAGTFTSLATTAGGIVVSNAGTVGFALTNTSASAVFPNTFSVGAAGNPNLISNWNIAGNTQSNSSYPSYSINLNSTGDYLLFGRVSAGGGSTVTDLMALMASGNMLFGTTSDNGTGIIQIPAATSATSGIVFGNDTPKASIYRSAASTLTSPAIWSHTNIVGIAAANANAFSVGPNGTTNPGFNVDTSTASAATGINIKSAAANGGVAVTVLSSGTNEAATYSSKGTGAFNINTGSIVSTGAVNIGSNTSGNITLNAAATIALQHAGTTYLSTGSTGIVTNADLLTSTNRVITHGLFYSSANDEYIVSTGGGNVSMGDIQNNNTGILIQATSAAGVTTQYNSSNVNTLMDSAGAGNMLAAGFVQAKSFTTDGTNKWQLGAYTASVPIPTGQIALIVNGTAYKVSVST